MELRFYKMHVAGNDFAYFEHEPGVDWPAIARSLCDRHAGIGANGLISVTRATGDPVLRLWAPDGSELRPCGDAIACAARFFADSGRVSRSAVFSTRSGQVEADIVDSRYVGIRLGFAVSRDGLALDRDALAALAVPFRSGDDPGAEYTFRIAGFPRATVALGARTVPAGHSKGDRVVRARRRTRSELECAARRDARFDGCAASAMVCAAASCNGFAADDASLDFSRGGFFARLEESGRLYVAACADYAFSGEAHAEPRQAR